MATKRPTSHDALIVSGYLTEALGKERQLHTALLAQIAVAERPAVKHALIEHRKVTGRQIDGLQRRLDQLDGHHGALASASTAVVGVVATVANTALAMAKGPLVVLRGAGRSDRELRALRDCYWNEAEEIAHYRVIESVAEQVGDHATAELARRYRAEEEAMQHTLEGQFPEVVRALVADDPPHAETPAATRAATTRTPPAKRRGTTARTAKRSAAPAGPARSAR